MEIASEMAFWSSSFTRSCLYIVDNIRKNGPLSATTASPFESNRCLFKKDIHSTKGLLNQIAIRILQRDYFSSNLHK